MNGHVGIHSSIQLNVHCERCSTSFPSRNARDIHVQRSENHPKCDKCDRRFANEQALRVHLVLSPNHYYCEQCDRDFQTPAGRRLHVETSPCHSDEGWEAPDLDQMDVDQTVKGWEDSVGTLLYPKTNAFAEALYVPEHYNSRDEYWFEDGLEYTDDEPMLEGQSDDFEVGMCSCRDNSSNDSDISGLSDINTEDITESVYDQVDRQISKELRESIRRDTIRTPNGGHLVLIPMLEISPEQMANLCPVYVGALPMDPVMEAQLNRDQELSLTRSMT